jgi:hypothetical protein
MTSNFDQIYLNLALNGFESILTNIQAFSTRCADGNANFNDVVKVPYATHTSASQAFSYSTGYNSDSTSIVGKDVTLNNLLYRVINIEDNVAGKIDGTNLLKIFGGVGQALARDVISSSFQQVLTEANFPVSSSAPLENNLTSSIGWSNMAYQADTLKWTPNGSAILAPSAYQYTLQNGDINKAYSYGSPEAIQSGSISNAYGFSVHKIDGGLFPILDQPAKGIIADNSAILFGFGVHTPSQQAQGLVNVTQAENNGILIQLRSYYDTKYAVTRYVFESVFGTAVGNANGLVWLK